MNAKIVIVKQMVRESLTKRSYGPPLAVLKRRMETQLIARVASCQWLIP